ncbi:hypothetical protein QR680_019197 [Steinernema hermaphroditum]|uniref:Uncharacterized protein n=1 Tax=Steinernema hermaphroditum TaxID=289476 RepID=A0AA39HMH1_9BILA|nr:hypothetical protein QR680_019197 [Steinernema hermaphroditum]
MGARVFGLFVYILAATCDGFSCKNDCGLDVDWFVGTKPPQIREKRSVVSTGGEFYFVDSKSDPDSACWTRSPFNISSQDGPIGATLKQIYANKGDPDVFYLVFNDQHPSGKTDSYRGHTKGVMLFNGRQGFFLSHSVPKFVDLTKSAYEYPETGVRNGQSFVCISFDSSALKDLGTYLLYTMPSIVDSQLPTAMGIKYLDLQRVIAKRSLDRDANTTAVFKMTSLGGQKFVLFAKHKKFDRDLYADWIAPNIKGSLYTETWLNGDGDLAPSCGKYKVHILTVTLPTVHLRPTTYDRRGWAASTLLQVRITQSGQSLTARNCPSPAWATSTVR